MNEEVEMSDQLATPIPPVRAKRAKLLNVVAAELGQQIVSGEFPIGEMIPAEPELCTRFAVSRTVVREAVQLLISKGMLKTRSGIGTWVPPASEWSFLDPLVLRWVQESGRAELVLEHLFRFRSAVEPAAAAEAALNATGEQLAVLENALERMRQARTDFDEWIGGDIDFHTAIYVATNNVFMAPLATIFRQYFRMSFRVSSSAEHHQHCLKEHEDVYVAIAERDPARARRCVQILLDGASHDVKAVQGTSTIAF
jgi:DNA-binding FadR family transcriptional regulator